MSVDSSLGSSNGGRPLSPVRKYGIPRYRVTLVREGRAIPAAESVHTSEGAAAILRPLFAGLDREQFLICGLDAKHKLIGINVVSTGSLNLTIVHPREVFKPLILMNAGAWLCAHNHPSGEVEPSRADEMLTQTLKSALSLVDVRVIDHFVVAGDQVISFAERGLV